MKTLFNVGDEITTVYFTSRMSRGKEIYVGKKAKIMEVRPHNTYLLDIDHGTNEWGANDFVDFYTLLEKHYQWTEGNNDVDNEPVHWMNTDLSNLRFEDCNLRWADMIGADLTDSVFVNVDMQYAKLMDANMTGCRMYTVHLDGANLTNADLTDMYTQQVTADQAIINFPMVCPEEGEFTGYKKAQVDGKRVIVELKIPEDSPRLSLTNGTCRCGSAEVVSVTSLDGEENFEEAVSLFYPDVRYKIGEVVTANLYNPDRWNCDSGGIHFFMTREEAVEYGI